MFAEALSALPRAMTAVAGPPPEVYQAWSVPQCGQPTEVVTSALKL